jgi:phage terminase large subunit-like protein
MSSDRKLSDLAAHLVQPEGIVSSSFSRVHRIALKAGIEYDRWQQGLGTLMLGKDSTGHYAAGSGGVVISICRQVGKTFTIGSILFILCMMHPNMKVLWTAHRTRTSDETFLNMTNLAKNKKFRRYVGPPRRANGQQEIRFNNGSRIMFGAREQGFGRGFDDVDIEVFDESQILTMRALDDMIPATNTANDPLIIFMGTPPKPGDPSEVFAEKRRLALSGQAKGMLYVEFSADCNADLNDRAQWSKANPSYPKRTSAQAIERMKNLLGADSFRREGLGIWDSVAVRSAIDSEQWKHSITARPETTGLIGYAIDMPPDRSSLAIGGCIKHKDGTAHIELKAFESTKSKGTAWAVDWIADRWPNTAAVVIDSQSPAMVLLPDLKARHVKVITTGAQDMGQACGRFLDMLRDGRLTHLEAGKQPALDLAVANATTRKIGSSGAVGWNKLGSDIDISPLVAITLALYGTAVTKRDPNRKQRLIR